jgi:colanic acid biosynthesis glycosyl transferase WcaI
VYVAWNEARAGNVLIAMTDPPLLGVPMAGVAMLRKIVFIQWLQDIFPEVAERLGLLKSHIVLRILRTLRDWSLRRSDASIVIGERMASFIASHCSSAPILISNWALTEGPTALVPDKKIHSARLRSEWGLKDAFVVGYSGNMGRAHRLDEIVAAAAALRLQRQLRFIFIGDGPQRANLQKRVQALALENVSFHPYQPSERLYESLTLPDIHIVSLDERLEGLIVPSKFVGVIAVGRPVIFIGAADGEIGNLIRQSGCGVCVSSGDHANLVSTLRELHSDHTNGGVLLKDMTHSAERLWRTRFKRQTALDLWASTIEHYATLDPSQQ